MAFDTHRQQPFTRSIVGVISGLSVNINNFTHPPLGIVVEAVINGEEIVILRESQPVVKLVAVSPLKRRPQFDSAKGLVTISDDFDEPLEDFKEYME
jgi:antitoxin (DNA-binding transcriptional repressor) of toxin-antitoxin stability system